jgi:catechol 2,3-dioxygenase-like lactoylglutathione lyase family enzyme
MFDHVMFRVGDRDAAERFFGTVLVPLGIDKTYRTSRFTQYSDFQLVEAEREHPVTRGVHVAFRAPSRAQVDAFWQAGVDAGYTDDGAPGERRQYREDYYGAFLRDPDGNSVEAVHHGGLRRGEGVIDHLWLRVADLAASTAFYRRVAAAAGFAERRADDERSAFGAAGPEGGSFSLVPGTPTANLHLAFPGDEAAVRRFYAATTEAGHRPNGDPGERPQYHAGYYAAYVFDPDGNNVEVVDHHQT